MSNFFYYVFSRVYSYLLAPIVSVVLFSLSLKFGVYVGSLESVLLHPGILFGGAVVIFFFLGVSFYWAKWWVFLVFLLVAVLEIAIIYLSGSFFLSWAWVPLNIFMAYWIFSARAV